MDKKLIKYFTYVLAFLLISSIFISKTNAFTTNPSSRELTPGDSIDIQVLAAPQTGESGIELDIQISGMTVTGFTASNGWLVSQGTCVGDVSFTTNSVCHLYGDTEAITEGQLLGTITGTVGASGTVVIDRGATEYATASEARTVTGTAATFTIAASGGTTTGGGSTAGGATVLPNTAGGTSSISDYFYLILGLTFLSLAALTLTFKKKLNENFSII
ncbi:MAG: hypothetical protein Q9M91_06085 [Candidatus Dojkabacteria bacterium]|nr:hypothetical protein [Candidatus Dojkabacteria bacterium]MDQ7021368.1 hypothetical protein [Candidatus Dojkabacteria bacterium]